MGGAFGLFFIVIGMLVVVGAGNAVNITDGLDGLAIMPAVMVGGELAMESLDLRFEPITKVYEAPLQLKANGGMLLIDDFGRQQIRPQDLLNRWIVPLEKGVDFLSLHTGRKFPIPFLAMVIFALSLVEQVLRSAAAGSSGLPDRGSS